jgi:hypothetical protein
MSEANLVKLEKLIRVKMIGIKNKSSTPKDSGIGKLINMMKGLDETLYDSILKEYKNILSSLD